MTALANALTGRDAALVALADDELAVGHVLTAVAGFGPELEINIALSSMGQDELGHARAYYSLALDGDRDAINEAIYGRPAGAYRAAPISWVYAEAWDQLVVKSYLYETADAERRAALAVSPGRGPLSAAVARMEGEERYHIDFWSAWLRRTVERSPSSRARVQAAVDDLWGAAGELFEVEGVAALLGGNDLRPARERWASAAVAALAELGLSVPVDGSTAWPGDDRQRILDELQPVYKLAPGKW